MLRTVPVLVAAAIAVATLACTGVPPDAPIITPGRSVGAVDSVYTYTFELSEPDAQGKYQHRIDWGTGSSATWTDITDPTQPMEVENAWHAAGDYDIKVMVRDRRNRESPWSDPMSVHIAPKFPDRLHSELSLADGTYGGLVTADGQHVLVGSGATQQVMVLEVETNQHNTNIALGGDADEKMAFSSSPDGKTVYVCHGVTEGQGRLSAIRLSDMTVAGHTDLPPEPNGVAVHPNGEHAFVAMQSSGRSLLVVRLSDMQVTDSLDAGDWPKAVAFSPDGNYAYVAAYGLNAVFVVRASDLEVVATVAVSRDPYDVVVTPDGRFCLATCRGDNELAVISTADNTVEASLSTGERPWSVEVLPNGEYAYISALLSGEDAYAWVVRISDLVVVDSIPLVGSERTGSLCATPDGSSVFAIMPQGKSLKLGF
jgi:YVTN family beta-propeller protein